MCYTKLPWCLLFNLIHSKVILGLEPVGVCHEYWSSHQPLTRATCLSLTDSPAAPEEDEDHSEDNDSSPYVSEKVSHLHTLKSLMKKTTDLSHRTGLTKLLHIDQIMLWQSYFPFPSIFYSSHKILGSMWSSHAWKWFFVACKRLKTC